MILSNQKECPDCGDNIWSAFRHDYKTCSCGKCMVDGGMDYLRGTIYGIDKHIVVPAIHVEGLLECISDPTKTDLGKLCRVAIYLRDWMGINIGELNQSTIGNEDDE